MKQQVLNIMSVHACVSYEASKLHAFYAVLYYLVCSICLYFICPLFLTKSRISWKMFIEYKMCVLIFSKTFLRNVSHSKKHSTI
jgi:hypothetical protein